MSAGRVSSSTTRTYVRRQPESTVLYGVVGYHLPALLDLASDRSEHPLRLPALRRARIRLGFLYYAKPAMSLCARDDARATLCIDYGGLDIFTVELASAPPVWTVSAITWHQRGRSSAPK